MPRITGYRKAHFNAAHRLYKPDWSDEKNLAIFGKCSNPYFHGHKNLNIEVEEFKTLNPTAENICVVSYNKLRKHLPSSLDLEITLYETPRNFVRYSGE